MKRLVLFFIGSIFFTSCGEQMPKGIIKRDAMISLLVDIQLAEANAFTFLQDSIRLSHQSGSIKQGVYAKKQVDSLQKQIINSRQRVDYFYAWVYKKHHTTHAQFNKSLNYYSKNPGLLEGMYAEVGTQLEEKIKETKPAK